MLLLNCRRCCCLHAAVCRAQGASIINLSLEVTTPDLVAPLREAFQAGAAAGVLFSRCVCGWVGRGGGGAALGRRGWLLWCLEEAAGTRCAQ